MRPLDGVRIVEFGQFIAVPMAAAHLATLGADVVKVEPLDGDPGRHSRFPGHLDRPSPYLMACNQNKRSIAVDLKTDAGREAVLRLIGRADVVVENFRPGVLDRLGVGRDRVCAADSRLVHVSMTGYHPDSSLADRPAVDPIIQAASGMVASTGTVDGPPVKVGAAVVDHAAAHLVVEAVLTGLLVRGRTGEGTTVTLSLFDAALDLQAAHLTTYLVTGEQPPRTGNGAPTNVPSDCFATRDGAVQVAAYADRHWVAFCAALGHSELAADLRFATRSDRIRNGAETVAEVAHLLAGRTTDEVLARLHAAGVMAARVADYADVASAAHVRESGALGMTRGPDGRPYPALRSPLRDLAEAPVSTVVPALGEHTAAALAELGYPPAEVERLAGGGVILCGFEPETAVNAELVI